MDHACHLPILCCQCKLSKSFWSQLLIRPIRVMPLMRDKFSTSASATNNRSNFNKSPPTHLRRNISLIQDVQGQGPLKRPYFFHSLKDSNRRPCVITKKCTHLLCHFCSNVSVSQYLSWHLVSFAKVLQSSFIWRVFLFFFGRLAWILCGYTWIETTKAFSFERYGQRTGRWGSDLSMWIPLEVDYSSQHRNCIPFL
jgi:hypothetical protein